MHNKITIHLVFIFLEMVLHSKKKSPLYSDITSRRLKLKRLKISKNLFSYIYSQINKNINNLETLFSDINSKKKFNKFLSIMLDTKYKNLVSLTKS